MRRRCKKTRSQRINSVIPLVILIIATLLQTTLSPYIKINNVHPDLVLVLVIGWTCLRGFGDGIIWALIGGLCLDLVSGAPFGLFTLALVVVTIIASLFHGRLFGSSIVLPLILTFPLSLLFNGLVLLALNLLGRPVAWNEALTVILVPASIFNTVAMLIIFPLLYMLNRWLNPQPLSF